jgi:hypothetical protein
MFSRFICLNSVKNKGKCDDPNCKLQHIANVETLKVSSANATVQDKKERKPRQEKKLEDEEEDEPRKKYRRNQYYGYNYYNMSSRLGFPRDSSDSESSSDNEEANAEDANAFITE